MTPKTPIDAQSLRPIPSMYCQTCQSWRHTQPCGRDDCPTDIPSDEYTKGYADGLNDNSDDPRVERIEAGFKALYDATNGDYSPDDMIVLDALQAAREFAVRLARREEHIRQLLSERA